MNDSVKDMVQKTLRCLGVWDLDEFTTQDVVALVDRVKADFHTDLTLGQVNEALQSLETDRKTLEATQFGPTMEQVLQSLKK